MNNPAVNQALIELEESLSKIESARTQVNNVAEKSELLIKAFNKVYVAITAVDKNITIDEKAIKNHLDESFQFFRKELSAIVKESKKGATSLQTSLEEYDAKFESLLSSKMATTDGILTEFGSRLNSNFNEKNEQLKRAVSKSVESIRDITKNIAFDKDIITRQLNDNFEVFNSGLLKIVKETEKNLKNLETAIGTLEKNFSDSLKWTLESAEERIKDVLTEVEAHSKMTISFIDSEMKTIIETTKKTNEQMISFENNVRLLEKRIQEFDLPNEIKNIEQKINSNQKQTLIIGIIIILGLIAIAIFK
jgi:exonuclease VII small subunit